MLSTTNIGYTDYMPSKLPMLHIVIEDDLLQTIDDFRFDQRFESRAAAIKWLLRWALSQNPPVEPNHG